MINLLWRVLSDGAVVGIGIITGQQQHEMQYRQLLATAISLRVKQLRAAGGPTVEEARRITAHLDRAQDTPLYRLQKESQTPTGQARSRELVEALAVLSFIPGGIDALGLHCQANRDPIVTMLCVSLM